jgi:hypothetical protein
LFDDVPSDGPHARFDEIHDLFEGFVRLRREESDLGFQHPELLQVSSGV